MICGCRKKVPTHEDLSKNEQVLLRDATMAVNYRFTATEILELYIEFRSLAETGNDENGGSGNYLSKNDEGVLKDVFIDKTRILNNVWSTRLAEKVYDSIDKNNDGFLNFTEFCQYNDCVHNGTDEDKLMFSFKVMDNGRKNYLTRQDIFDTFDILLNIQAVLTGEKGPVIDEINTLIDYIMNNFDENRNDKIEWEEFSATSNSKQELKDIFQILSGSGFRAKLLKKYNDKNNTDIVTNMSIVHREYNNILGIIDHLDQKSIDSNYSPNQNNLVFKSLLSPSKNKGNISRNENEHREDLLVSKALISMIPLSNMSNRASNVLNKNTGQHKNVFGMKYDYSQISNTSRIIRYRLCARRCTN